MKHTERQILLELRKDELLHDIAAAAHIEGSNIESHGERVADILEEEVWVTRKMDAAYAKVLGMLQTYITEAEAGCSSPQLHSLCKGRVPHTTVHCLHSDNLTDKNSFLIALHMPDNFPQAAFGQILTIVHEYMVATVMMEWLLIQNNAERASFWIARCDELASQINELKNRRRGVMIRPMSVW